MTDKCIVWDLDDTLYAERDFVHSAFQEIIRRFPMVSIAYDAESLTGMALHGKKPMELLVENFSMFKKEELLTIYRNHHPNIQLKEHSLECLEHFKQIGHKQVLVTDGRSITQRNKIKALGIESFFDDIFISEERGWCKPDIQIYNKIASDFLAGKFFVIADNPTKDFVTPNALGWTTVMLLAMADNVHGQNLPDDNNYHPSIQISTLASLIAIVNA